MTNATRLAVLVQILAIAVAAPAARLADPADCVCIERLSPRVVLAYWLGTGRCNLTAIASAKGLVVIDTEMSPRIMAPIKRRIEQHFARTDWACVLDTHAHIHHAGGNSLFPGVPLVGHDNLPADMEWLVRKQTDPDAKRADLDRAAQTLANLRAVLPQVARRADARRIQGEILFWQLYIQDLQEGFPVVKPTITFADRYSLDLGDLTLELFFFGRGHSNSDILIYIPQEKLLVTGAIAYQRGQLPEIGEDTDRADLDRYLATLDHLLAPAVQIDRVIPSHSPPLRKADLQPVRAYYRKMIAEVQQARRGGLTLDETIQRLTVRAKFPNFIDPPPGHWAHGMQPRNVRNLWRILSEEPKPPQGSGDSSGSP